MTEIAPAALATHSVLSPATISRASPAGGSSDFAQILTNSGMCFPNLLSFDSHATLIFRMPEPPSSNPAPGKEEGKDVRLWCPNCGREVNDPLVCGDCSAVICRVCGTPLESADELAFG
jgi:hypothetical protein